MSFMRKAFVICSWKSVKSFMIYGDSKKYIFFVRYGVCKIDQKHICRKYVWVVCEKCICKIYASMR